MKCAQYVVIYWSDNRLLAFTFNSSDDICISSTAITDHYIGKDKTYVTMAMASIFHYPSIWTIRPES